MRKIPKKSAPRPASTAVRSTIIADIAVSMSQYGTGQCDSLRSVHPLSGSAYLSSEASFTEQHTIISGAFDMSGQLFQPLRSGSAMSQNLVTSAFPSKTRNDQGW